MKTLFYDTGLAVQTFMYVYSLKASESFIECADRQLTEQFIRQTGIKPGKNVNFSISGHDISMPVYGSYARPDGYVARKLMLNLYVNHHWNPVTIFWKSKSGRDYKLHDEVEDGSDIEFWFQQLDTALYLQQLYPGQPLPFRLGKVTYALVVERVNMDCTMILEVKEEAIAQRDEIIQTIHAFIAQYNTKSEAGDRQHGVVHQARAVLRDHNMIDWEIDLGSTGPHFLKQLLLFLSKLGHFSEVRLE